MNKIIYHCYVPQLVRKFLDSVFLENDIPVSLLMTEISSMKGSGSSVFFARRMLLKIVSDAMEKNISTSHINMNFLNYEGMGKELYPFFGDKEKPYLLVNKKNAVTFEDYEFLAEQRKTMDFTIIESLDFNNILLEDFYEERDMFNLKNS